MLFLLPAAFFFIALIYSMAGFGGGSSYIALLAISGLPVAAIPVLALLCNLIVTAQGSFLIIKGKHAEMKVIAPLLTGSIPMAFLGGAWSIAEETFIGILALSLTLASAAMIIQRFVQYKRNEEIPNRPTTFKLLITGGCLGLIAGITGIGGGIYLAPVMHLLNWASVRTITACTSLFIAFNSAVGLIGHATKGLTHFAMIPVWLIIACPVAVLIGGKLGSSILTKKLPSDQLKTLTACVILLVAIRLWVTWFSS